MQFCIIDLVLFDDFIDNRVHWIANHPQMQLQMEGSICQIAEVASFDGK